MPSTEWQESECRTHAEKRGHTVVDTYTDVDLSGYREVNRPDFERLLADLRGDAFDAVMAWSIDRLTRKGSWRASIASRRSLGVAPMTYPSSGSSSPGALSTRSSASTSERTFGAHRPLVQPSTVAPVFDTFSVARSSATASFDLRPAAFLSSRSPFAESASLLGSRRHQIVRVPSLSSKHCLHMSRLRNLGRPVQVFLALVCKECLDDPVVTSIGDKTTPKERRRLMWARRLSEQLAFVQWTPKRFVHELNEAGCVVSRQAIDQWLRGETSPSPENQAYIAKVLGTAPHLLFPVEAA